MDGFDGGDRELLTGQIDIQPATRERLVQTVAAIILGSTPEEITAALEAGEFVPQVAEMLSRPHERAEMDAHVDLLLGVLQTAPVGAPV